MKRVLITGSNSYIGTNVEEWLMREPAKYYVETLDMKDPSWKNFDFSKFDIVFHVAGVAHISTKKSMKELYFSVNRDLTIETAVKAKELGVKHFIFMSSMIVYNSKETKITLETKPNPDNFYGLSKLEAEDAILLLNSNNFKVTVLRPPMIYGFLSKGNFKKLSHIAKKSIIFPNFINKRSTLFVLNLCLIIDKIITEETIGVLFPQNNEYFSTTAYIIKYRKFFGKKTITTKIFNPIIILLIKHFGSIRKIFGDYYYDIERMEKDRLFTFDESLKQIMEDQRK